MAFTVEYVKSLLQRDLVTELENVKINIVAKIKQVPYLSQSKLYEHLTVLKTVRRDLLVERDIPDGCSGKAIALRSEENGNCLFSAFSIVMSGDNRYVDDLRILTSIELYLNSEFYAKHPSFVKVMNSHSGVFNNVDTLLALSVSHSALDSGKTKMELVKEEALNICSPFKWSGFLCVLSLSSVCLCFVHCYYKSYDAMLKYKIMFNQLIKPQEFPSFNSEIIHLLFCNNSIVPPTPFRHNHYVPLIFCSEKNKVNKKRKLVTLQECKKGNTKHATYSIHHYMKQDLNVLSNFADDLNVCKSPSVSKSSTFDVIADNFSSFDNNFLKLNSFEQSFISKSSNSDSISMSTSFNKSIPQNFTVSSSKIKCCLASSTGVQGKALVSNSTSFSDIASKCISSTVPVTNPSCNINFDKKSYPLSCSDRTSKSFLSAVSQINTSCNVKSNDKSYSLSYSKVFSKPIVKDMKYSSFKIEDPPSLEDGILSDGPESSCIYKSKYDVATYREKAPHLSYSEKVDLIKNVFVPEKNFRFPETARSFKYEWLLLFPWLCYSPSEDASYCSSCVLFGHDFPTKASRVKNLFSQPFRAWPSAVSYFKAHCEGKKKKIDPSHESVQSLHFSTWPKLEAIFSQIKGSSHEINLLCDRKYKHEVEENRKILVPIIDTIVTLGRLGLSFRGHRDDSKYHPKVGEYSTGGVGNFVEFPQFRVRGGDKVLEQHLKTCSKNASYISKTSQNDLIGCCGQFITELVVRKIKENHFFSILADEASDCSNQEQMSLVIRYVDSDCVIREEFLGFLHCDLGLSGKALAETVLGGLIDVGLDIRNCRGQGYDGAAAVSGHINGLSAHICKINNKAIYTHCHSHRLNLVIGASCNIQCVRNVFDQIKEISYFFKFSEPRQKMLINSIKEHAPDSQKKKLSDFCPTRWVEKVTGLDDFEDLFAPIVFCLEEMSLNIGCVCNQDTSAKATSFYKLMTSFDFLSSLVITRSILDLTLPVTQLLQGPAIDIADATHLIESMKSLICCKRNTVDTFHKKCYSDIVEIACKVGIEECKPRTSKLQRNRNNIPSESVSDYFRKVVTIPLLDHLTVEIERRFDHGSISVYSGLVIIPSKMVSLVYKNVNWREKFSLFADLFKDDFPCPKALEAELDLWETYWLESKDCLPDNISSTLKRILFNGFNNIKVSLRILGTSPVTTCTCERSFSAMRRLKTYTRSTMVSERLNGIALMHVHQEIVPDIEKVIDLFSTKNRRLSFT